MDLPISLRADVLDAITHELRGAESLADVIEDVAYWEAAARKQFAGSSEDTSAPIDPTTTSPLTTIALSVSDVPVRMLRESMRPGESLEGLVTALLIAEVRYRRTDMHWPIFSAGELIMTDDATTIDCLIHHDDTTITTTVGGHIMYTITADVRTDVLRAFDATLEAWEDRSEELAALIHLEDEVRDEGWSMASAESGRGPAWTVPIEVRLDEHDHAALERVLRTGGEASPLFTALMLSAVNESTTGSVSATDPLLIPA
ncbi:MAG: hypothetical protein L0I80_03735 [Brevibacterium sp.]|nr:hypothetical protein [Brevibacterium sp.]MDN5833131.1 hypothetical protein [Brevibacterium sp.]MDN5876735.1 hypothetical protein [Brevibacterium sp.]MDN5909841.1 hypothetical protein [Brevibacterium sp.]MDN6122970.1 hypothetical protein [Brevibacterium sp.]